MALPKEDDKDKKDPDDLKKVTVPDDNVDDDTGKNKDIDLDQDDEHKNLNKLPDNERNKAFAALRKEAAEAKAERDALKERMKEYEASVKQREENYIDRANREALAQQNRYNAPQREVIGGIPVPQTSKEWDELAETNWQAAVDLRSIMRARELQEQQRQNAKMSADLDESKNRVLKTHPELNDETSIKTKYFRKVLDSNPEYLRMSKGPILAMRDMEELMIEDGIPAEEVYSSRSIKQVVDRTINDRKTLSGSGGKGSSGDTNKRTVSLTKDEQEFCKSQGLSFEDYAREKLSKERKVS